MNKIQDILKWWRRYDNLRIRISTISKSYELHLSMEMLPHLLGLHYGTSKNIKGYRLYNLFKDNTDEEIYENIRNHNKDKVSSVKNRINYFEFFMKNLEKAELYENVHPDTKIKSTFFMVEIESGKYLQLGIVENEYMDYMETFIVRDDDKYIKTSPTKERVTAIERYEEDRIVPFSFDENKNDKLLKEYYNTNNLVSKWKIVASEHSNLSSYYPGRELDNKLLGELMYLDKQQAADSVGTCRFYFERYNKGVKESLNFDIGKGADNKAVLKELASGIAKETKANKSRQEPEI